MSWSGRSDRPLLRVVSAPCDGPTSRVHTFRTAHAEVRRSQGVARGADAPAVGAGRPARPPGFEPRLPRPDRGRAGRTRLAAPAAGDPAAGRGRVLRSG